MHSTAFRKMRITQLLLVMKMTAFLLIACFLHVSARTTAQVTLKEKSASLEKVLAKIKQQSDYGITYDLTLIRSKGRPVAVDVSNVPVERALEVIFAGQDNLTYSLNGKVISVKEKAGKKLDLVTEGLNPRLDPAPPPAGIDVTVTVIGADNNQVLEGASVMVKGQNKGVATDINGRAMLKDVDPNATILIGFTGYVAQEIKLNGRNSVVVNLVASTNELQEVIINKGYYKTNRITEVGNVSTVSAKEIDRQPVSNPLLALQGRVPGMIVTQANGIPGGQVTVQIRGMNSLIQNNNPLYIVDGVPYGATLVNTDAGLSSGILGSSTPNPFSFLNPNDILTIDVLKDADATAIYGSRGANGVVLIATKKGTPGKMKLDVNIQSGIGKIGRKANLMNTQQYLEMRKEAKRNDNTTITATELDINGAWDTTRYTDWQDVMIGGTAHYNDVQTAITGGAANTQYRLGTGYHRETTVFPFPKDFNDQKFSIQLNVNNTSVNQKFRIAISANYLEDINQLPQNDFTRFIVLAPNGPLPVLSDGTLDWKNYSTNPFSDKLKTYRLKAQNLIANLIISYSISKNLELKIGSGYTSTRVDERTAFPISYWNPAFNATTGSASFNYYNVNSKVIEPQLSYQKVFGKGKLNALIGSSFQQKETNGQLLNGDGYPNDALLGTLAAAVTITKGTTLYEQYKYASLIGRLNYTWDEKYLLNLTARRDGSSRFGEGRQFGNFGAIGIGWVFSNESFVKDRLSFLSFGKLRASYGITGNEPGRSYQYLELFTFTGNNPYQGGLGLFPNNLPAPKYSWEEIRKFETGLEFGFLKDRITLNAVYYRNQTSNQLVGYNLASITGFSSVTANLPAVIQNTGWEVSLNSQIIRAKYFSWETGINISATRNKLASFPNIINSPYNSIYAIGEPLNNIRTYLFAGVDPQTGIYSFYDSKGNITTTPNPNTDKIGRVNMNPSYYGGFQNSFRFKKIQLDIFFQFISQMGRNYLFTSSFVPGRFVASSGGNQPVEALERWRKPGDVSRFQMFTAKTSSSYSDYATSSDLAYSDASFIRLKTLSLSYELPEMWANKIRSSKAQLYIHAQNLFTISKYKGVDPENQSLSSLPVLRVITAGIRITF